MYIIPISHLFSCHFLLPLITLNSQLNTKIPKNLEKKHAKTSKTTNYQLQGNSTWSSALVKGPSYSQELIPINIYKKASATKDKNSILILVETFPVTLKFLEQ